VRPAHLALAVLVAAIWGLNFVVIEVGLEDFPPLLLSALRYALAALPLIVLGGMPALRWRWVLAVGVAIGVVKFSLLFIGMDVGMPAGLASLVLQAQALFTVVLAAVVLRERIRGSHRRRASCWRRPAWGWWRAGSTASPRPAASRS